MCYTGQVTHPFANIHWNSAFAGEDVFTFLLTCGGQGRAGIRPQVDGMRQGWREARGLGGESMLTSSAFLFCPAMSAYRVLF